MVMACYIIHCVVAKQMTSNCPITFMAGHNPCGCIWALWENTAHFRSR